MAPPTAWPPPNPSTPLAVLVSGGLDSAVLLAEAARVYPSVRPLYIRVGLIWEAMEQEYLERFLTAIAGPSLQTLVILEQPVADIYGSHWSLTGRGIPGSDTRDDAVFLPGRNILLLGKSLLWCHLHGIPELATAPLGSNPFPDATPEFYDGFANLVSQAVGGSLRILRPYADLGLKKTEVIRRGVELPLELTFSCLHPLNKRHCGRCNKCAERKAGFRAARVPDPTEYAELSCFG